VVAVTCSGAVAVLVTAANRPAILLASPSNATSPTTIEPAVLATGEATVSTRPDLAIVSAGIESQQSTAAAAQSDLAVKAGKLIARIKALGVADKDLSTSGYWIGPDYRGGQTVSDYRASEQLTVRWHNVDTVGRTLDAIVQEGGATNVGVGFGLADPKAAQAEARAQAIGDARAKAQAMATAAGVKLGQVLRISDLSAQAPIIYGGAAAAPASTQVPVGELSVSVTVEVDFAIA
jgi:uncharacterized protein